jgi:hypothetical protein
MAKKKNAKKKPAAAAGQKSATPIKQLSYELRQRVDRLAFNAKFRQQRDKVERLERELEIEREVLEHSALALRRVEKFLNSDELRTLAESGPHDAGLKAALARPLELNKKEYDYKKRKYVAKPTGAKPWKDLRRDGATDKQIATNLHQIKCDHSGDSKFKIRNGSGETIALERKNAGEYYSYTPVIVGMKPLVAAVRRVMQIGEPVKSTAAPKPASSKKTPAPQKSNKKPAAKKRSKPAKRSTPAKKKASIELPIGKLVKGKATVAKAKAETKKRSKEEVSKGIVAELGLDDESLLQIDRALFKLIEASTDGIGYMALAGTTNYTSHQVSGSISRLQSAKKIVFKKQKYWAVRLPGAAPAADVSPASTNGKAPALPDVVDIIRELGPTSSKTAALKLGLTTDAAGALLRRRVKAGLLKKSDDGNGGDVLYELAATNGKPAPAVPPEDVALNADFEKAIRDRGKKRNEVRAEVRGEEPIDEEAAGLKSLAEER